jgi:hypothetical protein
MQPEDIIELLESDNINSRRKGLEAYFKFLVPPSPEDGDSKGGNQSAYKHTKLWKTIRKRVWNGDEADAIICNFFTYIMKRFRTGEGILSDEEIAKEKEAPKIQTLEAFAIWKCKFLIIDYERKMGKQREREVITEKPEELGLGQTVAPGQYFREKDLGDTKSITDEVILDDNLETSMRDEELDTAVPNEKKVLDQDENLLSNEGDNTQKLIEECVRSKLIKFAKEVSPDGAEAIGMQINGSSIKEIAKWQKRTVGAQKQFLRASKLLAADYLAPCNEINAHSKAPKKLRKK